MNKKVELREKLYEEFAELEKQQRLLDDKKRELKEKMKKLID